MYIRVSIALAAVGLALVSAACAEPKSFPKTTGAGRSEGTVYAVSDTSILTNLAASGTADAVREATLATKLMGTVTEVLVREGDAVAAGQPLVRIDARDLAAKETQVAASIADAEAMHRDALTQAGRMRSLYNDSAATRAQVDAAELGLARAEAAVRSAHAAASEVSAMTSYSVVRAPFGGIVTKRFVDPGAFATPGAPLLTVQDGHELRISASTTPDVARMLGRGRSIDATIEGRSVAAVVEGVVPAAAGNLYTINALVANPGGAILPGSTATLLLPLGMRKTIVVPSGAIVRQGDLTGVTLRTASGDETRWVRLGATAGDLVEVSAGLKAGDQIVIPLSSARTVAVER